MKYPVLLLVVALFFSCKPEKKARTDSEPKVTQVQAPEEKSDPLPKKILKVLESHGGLDRWKKQRTLAYDLKKGAITETHTIDLWNRWDLIDAGVYRMGNDGTGTWLDNPEAAYEGNPDFYHNLMFYFYAMPFVLADPGILYSEAPAIEFEGVTYPGIRIAYEGGVGTSPEDEYFLHYEPESHRMAWLGYTVTYGSDGPSENVKWIRYDDWKTTGGLLLPSSISWYTYEGRDIKELRSTVDFENIRISQEAKDPEFFSKPESVPYYEEIPNSN